LEVRISSEIKYFEGFCSACNSETNFLVDHLWGGTFENGFLIPNWRERLECVVCKMNNRQRIITALIRSYLNIERNSVIYLMEQVTPIFKWVKKSFPQHKIIGSEYLGYNYRSGTKIDEIRHENIEELSLSDESVDLIISNDVFEHVPNPLVAFSNCSRVLRKGGVMLATFPFHTMNSNSVTRALLLNGKVKNILDPIFHGNPINENGSLVFTDFGWDVLGNMIQAGFKEVNLEIYSSKILGHYGHLPQVFRAVK